MKIGQRTGLALATFFVAAATGHMMQHAGGIASALGLGSGVSVTDATLTSADAETQATPLPAELMQVHRLPDLPKPAPAPALASVTLESRIGAGERAFATPDGAAMRDYDTYGRVCTDPALVLTHLPPAMIGLSLSAPCHASEVATLSHAGLTFRMMTDADGQLRTTIPALAADGAVTVAFAAGAAVQGRRAVPDLGTVRRYAILTRGPGGPHLNAFVKGASEGSAGHIRAGNDGLPTLGLGGYLTELGDPTLAEPRLAEVFTAPALGDPVRLTLAAEVIPETCGRDLLGMTLTSDGTVVPVTGAVSLSMPDCASVGARLVMDLGPADVLTPVASTD